MGIFIALTAVTILGITTIIGCFAFFMFLYRLHVISNETNEKEMEPRKVKETSPASSQISTFNGKNISIIADSSIPSASKSGNTYTSNVSKSRISLSPTKINSDFEKKLEDIIKRSEKKKHYGRFPAWDEVEMRRHGLVDRYCDRVYLNECPSNPSTVDVSNYNGGYGSSTPASQNSFRCSLPPDSSSYYSNFSNPFATSTPRSYTESAKNIISEKDVRPIQQPNFDGAAPPKRASSSSVAPSVVSQYAAGLFNDASQQQQSSHQYHVTPSSTPPPLIHQQAVEPPNASPMPPIQEPPQTARVPMVPSPEFVKTAPTQVSSNLQQSIQNLSSPGPSTTVGVLKTAPTQTSSNPSLTSVYVEPGLLNSAYAYQKPEN
uniref:Uncharacterized protein n=1 Tax=Panagrolaimus superbus TaxID=310955 RepID=A0A914Z6Y0_9BILA